MSKLFKAEVAKSIIWCPGGCSEILKEFGERLGARYF